MMRLLLSALILMLMLPEMLPANSTPIAHTCQRQINSLLLEDGCLYGTTTGGLFIHDTLDQTFSHYTVLDGLSENDCRVLSITDDRLLWSASADARLDLFELNSTDQSEHNLTFIGSFTEFATDDQIFSIHDMAVMGEWILVATDIGFTRMQWDVGSGGFTVDYTIRRPGALGYEVPIRRVAVFDDRIVLVAATGLALQDPQLGTPDQPESWLVYPVCSQDDVIRQLLSDGERAWLLISDADDIGHLYRVDETGVTEVLTSAQLRGAAIAGDGLLLADELQIYSFSGESGDPMLPLQSVQNFNLFARNAEGCWYHRSSTWTDPGGLVQLCTGSETVIPGPAMESFTDLQYDSAGRLWVSGQSAGAVGAGIAMLEDGVWTNYTCQTPAYRQQMGLSTGFEAFNDLLVDREGWVWLTTWGYGLILYRPELDRFDRFDEESTTGQQFFGPLLDIGPVEGYPITSGLSEDPLGNIWVLNNRSLTDTVLVSIPQEIHTDTTTSFRYLHLPETNLYFLNAEEPGMVWAGAGAILSGAGGAGDWGSSSKDLYGLLGDDPSLPIWEQTTLEQVEISLLEEQYNGGVTGSSGFIADLQGDLDGNFWVATTEGLYYSSAFLGDPTLFNRLLYLEGLSSEEIYLLALDPRNRLWVGTNLGLDLLDVSTFLFTDHYTEAATGTPWSNVRAVDFDPVDGTAAVITGRGVFLLPTGLAEHPDAQTEELHPYPNPFLPAAHDRVRLPADEVSRYATATVYTVSGRLVKRLSGVEIDQGWDGRTDDGTPVPTGIYLLLLSGSQGSATGKIAVVN